MKFLSENFWFNGISNKNMNVELITFDDSILNNKGIIYLNDLTLESGANGNPVYSSNKGEAEDIVLNLALVDELGRAKEWDNYSMTEIIDWLVTDDFKPFISEDDEELTYYFMVTKINPYLTSDMTGYLEVTFKPFDNYCYNKVVYKGKRLNIKNPSNIDDYYYPIIKVQESAIIKNTTTQETPLEIETSEGTTIDCETHTVLTDSGENILSKCNRKWLRLQKGKNKIESDKDIIIECNFPIIR